MSNSVNKEQYKDVNKETLRVQPSIYAKLSTSTYNANIVYYLVKIVGD